MAAYGEIPMAAVMTYGLRERMLIGNVIRR